MRLMMRQIIVNNAITEGGNARGEGGWNVFLAALGGGATGAFSSFGGDRLARYAFKPLSNIAGRAIQDFRRGVSEDGLGGGFERARNNFIGWNLAMDIGFGCLSVRTGDLVGNHLDGRNFGNFVDDIDVTNIVNNVLIGGGKETAKETSDHFSN